MMRCYYYILNGKTPVVCENVMEWAEWMKAQTERLEIPNFLPGSTYLPYFWA